jgi:hypothetical protein
MLSGFRVQTVANSQRFVAFLQKHFNNQLVVQLARVMARSVLKKTL